MKDRLDKSDVEPFMVCLWIVRHDRNKMVMEEMDSELQQTTGLHSFDWVKNYLDDFHRATTDSASYERGTNSAAV